VFDVGFWEILLIGVVGLLVIGPEKLPEVARNVGKWVGKTRRYVANVRRDFESELNSSDLRELLGEQEAQIRELRGMVDQTKREFGESVETLGADIEKDIDEVKSELKETTTVASDAVTAANTPDKPTDAT